MTSHPIVDKLRSERIRRGMSVNRLSNESGLSRNSIDNHEKIKFPALNTLDRWANALGFDLKLTPRRDQEKK